ncbi:MAG TPA: FAD-dependent oxidoreductase, partial [Verrucomicrobiales bacterium]|nr:FAD-dependent oxidoreductase [Verrucomicrobiales bacterium]
IAAEKVSVVYQERLDLRRGIFRQAGSMARIRAIRMESGRVFSGKVFIDATYEGDLMAKAGVRYHVGREANATYGETLNGVQTAHATKHQLFKGIDPYVKQGDPASGLLPGIDPTGPGVEGGEDHRLQAYCFRMCLTDHPDNRLPWAKPAGYRELDYELLFRNFEAGFKQVPWHNAAMPNRKTDVNNNHGFSTDYIGMNYEYADGNYATRERIVADHLRYQQGFMWTLAHHPRVPENVRQEIAKWGPCRDEFTQGGGWQEQLYIREARRMIGEVVMTQHHCQGRETATDPVGMAAYTMDSHNVQRHLDANGHVQNEGDVQVGGFPPFPISYRSLTPARNECENLLVPVCLSASHIAFGSIRMEPVFMVLGQSAATAAALAIDANVTVQEVGYAQLRERLLADGQILESPTVRR